MARRSSVAKLPAPVQTELDERIRCAWYGAIERHVEWLESRGHKVSKSAIGRYSQSLHSVDAANGLQPAEIVEQSRSAQRAAGRHRDALLIELGQLRLREAAILSALSVPLASPE
ncbi:phage protein Gp27 family protein [Rhodanobacter lindaniclasticus]